MRWVVERMLKRLPSLPQMDAAAFLERHVEFVLLHEFREGDFFDWHVDSKPDDGKMRTQNVNVVLSSADDFEGGALQVGSANASLQLGDLHAYPAALPHKVHDITKGRRYTLVVATRGRAEGQYWAAALRDYERLARELGGEHPKLHWIFGEFLEKTGDADAAAQFQKIGAAYRVLGDADARRRYDDTGAAADAEDSVEINHWFGAPPPNFRTLYLGQIEVDSADFWTDRLLSSSSRSIEEELASKPSHTRTLKSG